MGVSRHRPKGAFRAPFGLCVVAVGLAADLMPTAIGHQDLAALIAQRPMAIQRWHSHIIASPFGTIEAATFSMPMPISEAMPVSLSYALAGIDPGNADITGSIRERMLGDVAIQELQESYLPSSLRSALPEVNRSLKGDRLAAPTPPEEQSDSMTVAEPSLEPLKKGDRLIASLPPEPQPPSDVANEEQPTEPPAADTARKQPTFSVASLDYGVSDDPTGYWPDLPGRRPDGGAPPDSSVDAELHPDTGEVMVPEDADPTVRVARLYFGIDPMGSFGVMQPWMPGEAPQLDDRRAAIEPDFKTAALTPYPLGAEREPNAKDAGAVGGETIARKGQVTGEGQHPMSPAERLRLDDKGRAKAVKCLTEAIYFEARGEPVRGQIAVGQVILNRVRSPQFPQTICGVVYQGQMHPGCQFSFACDGHTDMPRNDAEWAQAQDLARKITSGQVWLPEVGYSTYYHANYVRPGWVDAMNKIDTIGRHIFYKKRNEQPYVVEQASATPAPSAATLALASTSPSDNSISATPALSLGLPPSE